MVVQASEEKYRSVVKNIEEVIFQTDMDGRWTFLNPQQVVLFAPGDLFVFYSDGLTEARSPPGFDNEAMTRST